MAKRSNVSLVRNARVAVIRNNLQDAFARRLRRARKYARTLVIASPWISSDAPDGEALGTITDTIHRYNIPTYICTRTPQNPVHIRALNELGQCSTVEIVLNDDLHAKVYVCLAPYPHGFALLGSANLTHNSSNLYELGLIVISADGGEAIVKELASFGFEYLRTRPESVVSKRISLQ